MKKWISIAPPVSVFSLLSTAAYATPVVPEIDGSSAVVALGLTVGVIALIREYRRRQ
jgi:hypothetical protein